MRIDDGPEVVGWPGLGWPGLDVAGGMAMGWNDLPGDGGDLDVDLVGVGGIFYSVGEEIDEDLFDLGGVGHNEDILFGDAAFNDMAGIDLPDGLDAFFDQLGQGGSPCGIFQFAGVDAGDIKEVGDEAVQLVDLPQRFFDKIFCQPGGAWSSSNCK
ncbi:hypothetical protein ACQ86N_32015 [Puia sp. P3]|uniref:hypothetical protein n=1 Tax=Puia sp. P3 TaxID=3423952 RepID=UPI003D68007A